MLVCQQDRSESTFNESNPGIAGDSEPSSPTSPAPVPDDSVPDGDAPPTAPSPPVETPSATPGPSDTPRPGIKVLPGLRPRLDPRATGGDGKTAFESDGLSAEIKNLKLGTIVWNTPDEMQKGLTERVEARIATEQLSGMKVDLQGRGPVRADDVRVGQFLRARLIGSDKRFEIVSVGGDEIQPIVEGEYTQWN